jgi:hypothetical protein
MPGAFQVREIHSTIRFIQGYRYLDRCGEAIIKLENSLAEGWIPTETSPKAGTLKNDVLGMTVGFHSESMTTVQVEFISFEHFLDQTCKIYDILWQTFDIKKINVPTLRVILQHGFGEGELDKAQEYLTRLNLCQPRAEVVSLLGGNLYVADCVLVTTADVDWNKHPVNQRRRLQTQVIRQERLPPFDERMLKRSRLLGDKQSQAIAALMKLRKQHPEVAPVAAQLDVEHSFETEFSTKAFDLPGFLGDAWKWAESVGNGISGLEGANK